jgi:hypothetical protein
MSGLQRLIASARSRRVIDVLRERYPGAWTYNIAAGTWDNAEGWHVYKCAALAPRYDGDDDTFITEYHRSDTRERLYFL